MQGLEDKAVYRAPVSYHTTTVYHPAVYHPTVVHVYSTPVVYHPVTYVYHSYATPSSY